MTRFLKFRMVVVLLALGVSSAALAQQRSLFDAFKSIFQQNPSPNVIPVTPDRPRRVRKPVIPLTPRRNLPAPKVKQASTPDIIPPAWPANAMPWPGAVSSALPPKVAVPTVAEDATPTKPTYFVQVLGDSIALLLAQGLTEALADRPEISVVKRARESSGLVRDDFFSWPKASRDLLASGEQIDTVLIMVGSNDHQPFYAKDGKILADIGTEDWLQTYRARAEEEVSVFKEKHAKLIWVGMPIMRSPKFSADMLQLNEIYRDVVTAHGETYIDIWAAFADEKGEFDPSGPDVNGQPARLRTSDGIHFTKAGQRKLTSFVEKEIRRAYEAKKQSDAPVSMDTPAPASPDGDASASAAQGINGSPIKVPELAVRTLAPDAEPVRIIRPVSGQVRSLTAPPVTASGELLPAISRRKALTRVDDVDPQEAHTGRTDDFTWPLN